MIIARGSYTRFQLPLTKTNYGKKKLAIGAHLFGKN